MSTDYSRYNDEELFETFKQNGKKKDAAFRELFSRYERRVYTFCLRMTGDPNDAADIFQETFARFYKQTRKDVRITNLLAYLLTSARNNFLNSRRNVVKWSPFDEELHIASQVPLYERNELMNLISSALDLLSDSYREAFIMRFYQGLSYKEISAITGDTVASLKIRVMRAKAKLRMILSPYINDVGT